MATGPSAHSKINEFTDHACRWFDEVRYKQMHEARWLYRKQDFLGQYTP
eukprot:CAMPEP_0180811976 /NCGR_PEP_ID=MMETSP1038_2-20121128/65737_1 /TAXON_ID=632150 /ORGANISM="Azadinium spinosum, Strain 3D9" /LENGTH=48 /DNA_ID= /DNA_START= /DNA_END= /DNA_ORIENTATION=